MSKKAYEERKRREQEIVRQAGAKPVPAPPASQPGQDDQARQSQSDFDWWNREQY